MVYSILSLVSIILLVAYQAESDFPNLRIKDVNQSDIFYCFTAKIGYNMLVYLCIWFNSFIAFERGLIIHFNGKWNATRWRSFVTIIVTFTIAGGCATPLLLYKCNLDNNNKMPNLEIAQVVFVWFYIVTGIATYVVATLL